MGIPIGELQERVTSAEFAEYWAFMQLEPFGPERDDLRTGIVASTIANANRDRKRTPRPFTPEQFMPRFEPPVDREEDEDDPEMPAAVDQEELARKIGKVMVSAFGGQDQRGEA